MAARHTYKNRWSRADWDSSAAPHSSHSHTSSSFLHLPPHLLSAMADFFVSSSAAAVAVAAKSTQQNKSGMAFDFGIQTHIADHPTVPAAPSDKAESSTATQGAGSNFSMCEIIM
ncbi:hypothetical protein RHS01_07202 [Rhizoctonia solani]|uniref:Uncharacterized protein n=1 Tax=Rhizoctonia solani TaxID=456999 RepID=A0A8H7IAR8_9AGAM|nr:hypothetical protein RHS01_07202 [Rhizoctonia solani]